MLLRKNRQLFRTRDLPWSLVLAALVLPGTVVQTQGLEDSGSSCAVDVASAQPDCNGNAGHCQDIRSSLLQVNSKTQSPTAQTEPSAGVHALKSLPADLKQTQEVSAPKSSIEQPGSGIGAALFGVAEVVYRSQRPPTFLLVVLALIIVAICVLIFSARIMGDGDSRRVAREGHAASVKGVSGFGSANSLPPAFRSSSAFGGANSAPSTSQTVPARSISGASPATTGRLPSQQGIPFVAARHLCPGLVVPRGNECILAVPISTSMGTSSRDMATLDVQDLDGKSVIQADVVMPQSARATDPQRALVVLRAGSAPRMGSEQAAPVLAYCKASHDIGSRKIVYIYDGRDELFAQISQEFSPRCGVRYALTSSRIGLQLFFEGDILHHAVNVTNEQLQVVSETSDAVMPFNPGGLYYKLRVASNIDVGLILCALFSMDFLERC
jgi:hypothetical protein